MENGMTKIGTPGKGYWTDEELLKMDPVRMEDETTACLNLFNGNSEQRTVSIDRARKLQLPVEWVEEADNTNPFPLSAKGLDASFKKLILENPVKVPTFTDQLEEINSWMETADWALRDHEGRAEILREQYRKYGVPYAKRLEMLRKGYKELPSGRFEKDGKTEEAAITYLDTCGQEERKKIEEGLSYIKEHTSFNAEEVPWLKELTEGGRQYLLGQTSEHYKKRIALMHEFYRKFGSKWNDMHDIPLRRYMDELEQTTGVDLSDIDIPTLREGGIGSVDYARALNVMGWMDIRDAYLRMYGGKKSATELSLVDGGSSVSDQLELIGVLNEQQKELRGLSFAGNAAYILTEALPYMAEFALTGGAATVAKGGTRMALGAAITSAFKEAGVTGFRTFLSKNGLKAVGEAAKYVVKGELKRTPLMLPKDMAQAINEWGSEPVWMLAEDGMKVRVPDQKVDELFDLIAQKTLSDYIDRTSEWGGEFLPGLELSRFVPKGIRNQVVRRFIGDAALDETKRSIFRNALTESLPLHGDLSEVFEEIWGNKLQWTSTMVSKLTGLEALNLGRENFFESGEELGLIALSSIIMSNTGKLAGIRGRMDTYDRLVRFVDGHRESVAKAEKVPLERRSKQQAEEVFRTKADITLAVEPEDALEFYQSDPEMATNLGITPDSVAEAQHDGRMVLVSESKLIAEQASSPAKKESGERLLGAVRSNGITIKEALGADFGKEAVDAIRGDRERREKFKSALFRKYIQAKLRGIPEYGLRAVSEVNALWLDHLSTNITSADDVVMDAIEALDVESGTVSARSEAPASAVSSTETSGQTPAEPSSQVTQETEKESSSQVTQETEKESSSQVTRKKSAAEKKAERWAKIERGAVDGQRMVANHPDSYERISELIDKKIEWFRKEYSETADLPVGDLLLIGWDEAGKAMNGWSKERGGSVLTLISTYLQNAFTDYAVKAVKEQKQTASLDAELTEDGGTLLDGIASKEEGGDQKLSKKEHELNLKKFRESLTETQGKVFDLLMEEKSYTEIGEELGISKQAVYDTVQRIRKIRKETGIELYQRDANKQGAIKRGMFKPGEKFKESFDAVMRLFKGRANVSTLCHESAHWLKSLMEALCEMKDGNGNYIASEQLRGELVSINQWLDGQNYSDGEKRFSTWEEATGYANTIKSKTRQAKVLRELTSQREEKFARGFEYYLMEGELPATGVASAFKTLRNFLKTIYRYFKETTGMDFLQYHGVNWMDKETDKLFESLFTTEETLEKESPLREFLSDLKSQFRGLLGLTEKETADFVRLAHEADAQMDERIEKEKKKLLPGLRKEWKEAAEAEKNNIRGMRVWEEAEKEKLDLEELSADPAVGKESADLLKKMKLAKIGGVSVGEFLKKHGYSSAQEMVQELLNTQNPKEFTEDFVSKMETKFHKEFPLSEAAVSVQKMRDAVDALIAVLSDRSKDGKTYLDRRREMKEEAARIIGEMEVKDVISDKVDMKSMKDNNRLLIEAISKKDFAKALIYAERARKNLTTLNEKASAKEDIRKTQNLIKRALGAKKGSIYGTEHEALKELAYYFGFTKRQADPHGKDDPNWRRQASGDKTEDATGDYSVWPAELYRETVLDYGSLRYSMFERLSEFARFLYGEGREKVKDEKGTEANFTETILENCEEVFSKMKHRYRDVEDPTVMERASSLWRGFTHLGYNLNLLLGRADGYTHLGKDGVRGPNIGMRDYLSDAFWKMVSLEADTIAKVTKSLNELYDLKDGIRIPKAGLNLTKITQVHGYSHWKPEMVISACLNMGTVFNRRRLMEGYGWTDEDLSEIASCLPKEAWDHVQDIWDALGGDLKDAVKSTFLRENHYHMKMAEADPFTVRLSDGGTIDMKGGYYPVKYAYVSEQKNIRLGFAAKRLHAEVSATKERKENVTTGDPVSLSLTVPIRHIHEVSNYAAVRTPIRRVLKVVMDPRYKEEFGQTQSFEAYESLLAILKNIANPEKGTDGFVSGFEAWARTALVSTALMGNLRTSLMQLTSITMGADELGSYYADALAEVAKGPFELSKRVKVLSPMMRHRTEYFDQDLRDAVNKFTDGAGKKLQKNFAKAGYAVMRLADSEVASIVWWGKYQQATAMLTGSEEGKSLTPEEIRKKAISEADDFVSRTQGASRAIDITPVQLSSLGRMLSPFITSTGAQYNTMVSRIGATLSGRYSAGEATEVLALNLVLPSVLQGLVAWLVVGGLYGIGGDDEDALDRANKAFVKEALSSPFGGMPIGRDIVNAAMTLATDRALGGKRSYTGPILDAGMVTRAADILKNLVVTAPGAAMDQSYAKAAWLAARSMGDAFGVPAIRIYERIMKVYKDNGGQIPDGMGAFEESIKGKGNR